MLFSSVATRCVMPFGLSHATTTDCCNVYQSAPRRKVTKLSRWCLHGLLPHGTTLIGRSVEGNQGTTRRESTPVVPDSVNAGDVFDIVVPATEAPASEEERAWCQWVVADACPNGWCLLKPLDITRCSPTSEARASSASRRSMIVTKWRSCPRGWTLPSRSDVEDCPATPSSPASCASSSPRASPASRPPSCGNSSRIRSTTTPTRPRARDHYQALPREAQRIEDYEAAHAAELLPAAQAAAMIDLARKRITAEA